MNPVSPAQKKSFYYECRSELDDVLHLMTFEDAHELLTQFDSIRGKYENPTERAKVKRSFVEAMIKKVSICTTCKQSKLKINTPGYCSC